MTSADPKLRDRWLLQDAKARFSELVRRARPDGPQHVTVCDKGERTGAALIAALQASPHREIDLEPPRSC
jgi:antitoxin (DNA-binding transcriptional repressor) of toxin-antitoxin stability system